RLLTGPYTRDIFLPSAPSPVSNFVYLLPSDQVILLHPRRQSRFLCVLYLLGDLGHFLRRQRKRARCFPVIERPFIKLERRRRLRFYRVQDSRQSIEQRPPIRVCNSYVKGADVGVSCVFLLRHIPRLFSEVSVNDQVIVKSVHK